MGRWAVFFFFFPFFVFPRFATRSLLSPESLSRLHTRSSFKPSNTHAKFGYDVVLAVFPFLLPLSLGEFFFSSFSDTNSIFAVSPNLSEFVYVHRVFVLGPETFQIKRSSAKFFFLLSFRRGTRVFPDALPSFLLERETPTTDPSFQYNR